MMQMGGFCIMGRWIRKRPFQDLKKVLNRLLRIGTGKRWLEGRGIWDIGLLQYGWPLQQEERLLPELQGKLPNLFGLRLQARDFL